MDRSNSSASLARPEEVTGSAVLLCSDDASFITGHVLVVGGGFPAGGLTVPSTGDAGHRTLRDAI